jgi:hypothetical protein
VIIQLTEQWRIASSTECWALEERLVAERGKHAGEERWVARGYYSRVENALVAAADILPREDVSTLPLRDAVTRIEAAIATLRDAHASAEEGR